MCLAKIRAFFQKKPGPAAGGVKPAALPHEPERPDYSRTLQNVNVSRVLEGWFEGWGVPKKHRKYWRRFKIMISYKYGPEYPAATSSETNEMWLRPEWANPGVVAHELAHESYSRLKKKKKESFEREYRRRLAEDEMIKYAYGRIDYMKTNNIEAHAEIYRYIGQAMPRELKKYYPKLF